MDIGKHHTLPDTEEGIAQKSTTHSHHQHLPFFKRVQQFVT